RTSGDRCDAEARRPRAERAARIRPGTREHLRHRRPVRGAQSRATLGFGGRTYPAPRTAYPRKAAGAGFVRPVGLILAPDRRVRTLGATSTSNYPRFSSRAPLFFCGKLATLPRSYSI